MIKANTTPDGIDVHISGNAEQIIKEAGAILGSAVGVLLPAVAKSENCDVFEAEYKIMCDIRDIAEKRLQGVRRELEGGEEPPQPETEPPKRRRRMVS